MEVQSSKVKKMEFNAQNNGGKTVKQLVLIKYGEIILKGLNRLIFEEALVKNIKAAKAAIKKAFLNQVEGKGFSLIEVLSTCPTNWGLAPDKAIAWLEENMMPYYPLGVYKDKYAE